MSILHAIILSLLQGAFELFPVSSLGHTVIVPALLGWHVKQSDASFLAFVVVLHLGTACTLLIFFRREWWYIVRAVARSIQRRQLSADPYERLGWLLVAGSIPAGVLGLLFKKPLNDLFAAPGLVAVFLIANGALLLAGDRLRTRGVSTARLDGDVRGGSIAVGRPQKTLATMGFPSALGVGAAQALALLPGFSRSGASMVGGLRAGLTHVDAARFSFLLATPLILAAGLLEVPELFRHDAHIGPGIAFVGFAISAFTAFLAVRFLLRYLETERLDVFGYYCMGLGIAAFCLLAFQSRL